MKNYARLEKLLHKCAAYGFHMKYITIYPKTLFQMIGQYHEDIKDLKLMRII